VRRTLEARWCSTSRQQEVGAEPRRVEVVDALAAELRLALLAAEVRAFGGEVDERRHLDAVVEQLGELQLGAGVLEHLVVGRVAEVGAVQAGPAQLLFLLGQALIEAGEGGVQKVLPDLAQLRRLRRVAGDQRVQHLQLRAEVRADRGQLIDLLALAARRQRQNLLQEVDGAARRRDVGAGLADEVIELAPLVALVFLARFGQLLDAVAVLDAAGDGRVEDAGLLLGEAGGAVRAGRAQVDVRGVAQRQAERLLEADPLGAEVEDGGLFDRHRVGDGPDVGGAAR
jgi:hypothetical protein